MSKSLLDAPYVYIDRYDLLLEVGVCESSGKELEIAYQTGHTQVKMDTIKIQTRARQRGLVIRGLARAIVLDRGLARMVHTPNRWLCERHDKIVCESASLTGACVPLGTGVPGEYTLLWGVQGPTSCPGVEEDTEDRDEEVVEGYDVTPLAKIYAILEKVHRQDVLADTSLPQEGWYKGGVMHRMASSMGRSAARDAYKIALESHAARASLGKPLLFVWDLVACDAPYGCLKYVLDAARPPMRERPDFESVHGLGQYLKFEMRKRRVPVETDMFEKVY